MYPILLSWGDAILPAWHTFYVLGAIAAYYLMISLAKKHYSDSIDPFHLSRLFMICYLGGYFGARALSIFIDEPELTTISERLMALTRFGPMTFYGGFLGSLGIGILYILIKRINLKQILDVAMPSGLLALAIGRIGCFLNGDDFGKPVPLDSYGLPPWWAVVFPNLEDHIPRYPIQLISTFVVAILVIIIIVNFKKIKQRFGSGSVGLIAAAGYAILRFFIEYFRGDPRGWAIEGVLTPSQLISILVLIGSCSALAAIKKRNHP